jgi:hypothetical protein
MFCCGKFFARHAARNIFAKESRVPNRNRSRTATHSKGSLGDLDQYRLVDDDQSAVAVAARADDNRSSRDGRVANRFATTNAATVAFGGWISEKA